MKKSLYNQFYVHSLAYIRLHSFCDNVKKVCKMYKDQTVTVLVITENQKKCQLIVTGNNDKHALLSEYLVQFITVTSTDFFPHQT